MEFKISIKFKKQDIWIGLYWEKLSYSHWTNWKFYFCIIPCFPICIEFKTNKGINNEN